MTRRHALAEFRSKARNNSIVQKPERDTAALQGGENVLKKLGCVEDSFARSIRSRATGAATLGSNDLCGLAGGLALLFATSVL